MSDHRKADGAAGVWDVTNGEFFAEANKDKGLHTSQDAKFYAISAKTKDFSNEGKTLVVQFAVKHQQNIDCGGGYIKLMPAGIDQATFNGDSKYNIMFGPDICGTSTRRVHAIFNHNGENKLTKKEVRCETDRLNHVYTLVVDGAERTYEIKVDGKKREGGKLEDDWSFLPPRTIKDPAVSKPADWVDEAMIDDPADVKPADWDSVPKQIADPEAEKPNDWDDESDGVWDAPKVPNPAYKGEWKAKKIANPAYKGPWTHPEIANPDFKVRYSFLLHPPLLAHLPLPSLPSSLSPFASPCENDGKRCARLRMFVLVDFQLFILPTFSDSHENQTPSLLCSLPRAPRSLTHSPSPRTPSLPTSLPNSHRTTPRSASTPRTPSLASRSGRCARAPSSRTSSSPTTSPLPRPPLPRSLAARLPRRPHSMPRRLRRRLLRMPRRLPLTPPPLLPRTSMRTTRTASPSRRTSSK